MEYVMSIVRCVRVLSIVLAICCVAVFDSAAQGTATRPVLNGFIPNVGQWPSHVLFLHREHNLNVWITSKGIVMDHHKVDLDAQTRQGHAVEIAWSGSHGGVAHAEHALPTRVSMFLGNNPSSWRTNIPVYDRVRVRNIYRGIDALYYIENGHVRYDLDVRPGADVTALSVAVHGADGVDLAPTSVTLKTSLGNIAMSDLFAYFIGGATSAVTARFVERTGGFGVDVQGHDGTKHLRIDPIVYGTYVGGPSYDRTVGVRVTSDGVIVGGSTDALTFPETVGKYQKAIAGEIDAFVALMSNDLEQVLQYSFYGGSGNDKMTAMTTDASGSVLFVGETTSSNLPLSSGAAGQIYRAQIDGFVAKLDKAMSRLEVGVYIGGNRDDQPTGVAIDNGGNIFVAGGTTSTAEFPTTLAHQRIPGGQRDGFLCRLTPNGGAFVFSTFYGKEGIESFTAVTVNSGGEPFVTGTTSSSNFETAPTPGRFSSNRLPYDRTFNGGNTDAFVIKFFSDGTLSKRDDGTYSTYFGGNGDDAGTGIFVDQTGRAIVVGTTTSTNLPTTGGFQTQIAGQRDIFMAVLSDDGRALVSCTYFGGAGNDDVLGVANLNATATGVLFGTTTSNDFPTSGLGAMTDRMGPSDGFISVINTASIVSSTLVGGAAGDSVVAVAQDSQGDTYFSLATASTDLVVSDSVPGTAVSGGADGYIGKYATGLLTLRSPSGGEDWCIGSNNTITWSGEEMQTTEKYYVELSTDGGSTWSILAKDLAVRSFIWRPDAKLAPGSGYRIRVQTYRGHLAASGVFTLNAGPAITEQPKDASACTGSVELVVAASGSGLKYQWRKNGAVVPGATTPTFRIAEVNAASAGKYDVVVTGSCNPSATSRQATVSVGTPTAITTQPSAVTVDENKSFTLKVVATGSTLTYQWQRSGQDVAGATAAEYSVTSASKADEGTYTCVVRGGCGVATTTPVTVTVVPSTSVEDELTRNGVVVLGPMPATDHVGLRIATAEPQAWTAVLRDQRGGMVSEQALGYLPAGIVDLDLRLGSLAAGVYALELRGGQTALRTQIVVTR
jgi:hypothetical protein